MYTGTTRQPPLEIAFSGGIEYACLEGRKAHHAR